MQVDIGDAVEGKLVAFGAILVDVSDSQARKLLHSFVVTGNWSELDGHQHKTLPVHMESVKRHERY